MTAPDVQRKSRPSMDDVAAAAGVSKAAVSKVIRNAYGVSPGMRAKVESAIDALGYRPSIAARSMRGASYTIGFEIPQLGNDFFTQIMQGAADELGGSGYQLIIAPAIGDLKGAPVLNALVDRQVDGFVAISPEVAPDWLERLGLDIPIVLLGRHDPSINYDTVTNDDARGAELVMEHLFELGHRRIAHLSITAYPQVTEDLLPHTIRRRAYDAAMASRGLSPRSVFSGPLEPEAYDASVGLLSASDRPTAIFAANDTLAIGALRARIELGLTAADVSIAGYDDIDLASHPIMSLTTVDQFGRESGIRAIRLLLERIQQGRTEARHEVISPELRARTSTQMA
ncbi:LacI family DNA-binding transcriptional regulator [Microbacterium sp. P02]|uniref:LacI family DNA-binding transcriptional regulator n=1 Tax=Microbacterium sp. P02 TaxID=3366260 RepID=UPI00366E0CF3